MGAFRLCKECGRGHDKPEILEDLFHYYRRECKCGAILPQYMTEAEWLVDLSDRIKELEKMLGINKL